MGSGKTTLGKEMAEMLHIPFLDSDAIIQDKTGLSVNQIFASDGEHVFRALENEVIMELFDLPQFVLAVGGGLPTIPGMMDRLNHLGTTVYLKVSSKEILNRITKDRAERPLLKDKSEKELEDYVFDLYQGRDSYYKLAKVMIEKDNITCQDVLQALSLR